MGAWPHVQFLSRLWSVAVIEFILGVLVAGMLLGLGLVVGLILYSWLYHRYAARIVEMERKAYADARFLEVKRVNAENERQLALKRKYAELPKTPEEEQKSFEESLKALPYTDEEREAILKDRRRM